MSGRRRPADVKTTTSKQRKNKVPWEGLVESSKSNDLSFWDEENQRQAGLGRSAERLEYSPKSAINYGGVQDTTSLFNNSTRPQQQQGPTPRKSNFNLNESLDSLTLRDDLPPRSSPSPNGRATRTSVNDLFQSSTRSSPEKNSFYQTSPTLMRKERASFGPLDPQVNPEIENTIISFSYVNFLDVLRYSKNNVNLDYLKEMLKKDILAWIDAFSIYSSIVCRSHPVRVHDLLKYQRNIIWIYRETEDASAWWRYDIAFRRKAELRQIHDWSSIDRDLYAAASSERMRETLSCITCLSSEHVLKKCPFEDISSRRGHARSSDVNGVPVSNNEAIERAYANPAKLLKKPNEGLRLKFAFG